MSAPAVDMAAPAVPARPAPASGWPAVRARLAAWDWVTDLGLLVVGAAAAVLTFTTLRDLAEACGITGTFAGVQLSYLVPVTVDAAGVVAARVWLRRTAGSEAVQFARRLAWACIGASVLGNAGQHGMAAYGLAVPWPVVVVVSAVPPAMLGAVVHLAHLTRRLDPVTEESDPDETPVGQTVDRTDEELMDELRLMLARDGKLPGREAVRQQFGIGSKRADRVRTAVLAEEVAT